MIDRDRRKKNTLPLFTVGEPICGDGEQDSEEKKITF